MEGSRQDQQLREEEMQRRMGKRPGRITKKIGKPYPDVFYGIKVTTEIVCVKKRAKK